MLTYSVKVTKGKDGPIATLYSQEGDLALPILLVSAASIGIFIYRLVKHFQK